METKKALYEGRPFYMAGKWWIIPPLSVRQFRTHFQVLTENTTTDFGERLKSRLPAIMDAVHRNYPDVTEDAMIDMLDLNTYNQVLSAIVASTEGKRTAVDPGENPVPEPNQTGAGSTAS